MKSRKRTVRRKPAPSGRFRVQVFDPSEIEKLESLRIDRRWSYRELSEQMSAFLGVRMPEPTIVKALRDGYGLPTTVAPIRKYIAHLSTQVVA